MSRVVLAVALLMLAAVPLSSQAPIDFPPGSQLRVQFPGETQPVEGSLVSADRESFVFRPSGDAFQSSYVSAATQSARVPYTDVEVLWVDLGKSRKHSAWRGALWGAYLGAGSGAVAGPFVAKSTDYTIGQASAGLSIGAGLIGAGVGAVVGAILAPDHRWKAFRFVSR
ncbi:MAG TPA: hypothetical protein VF167_01425 [Longimicrobiaceae bacterium]